MLDWLSAFPFALVVMEATGRLHELAWRMADAEGLSAAVVNPARVRHFARDRGTLAKTDKIAALTGLTPVARDSGAFRGRRHIIGGRNQLRTALYMATLSAIQWNPQIKTFQDHLKQQGKLPKVVITAAMRKIIVTLNAMIRDDKRWQSA